MWEQNQHVFLGGWSGQACQTITGNGEVEAANCSLGAAAKKPSANPRGLGEEPRKRVLAGIEGNGRQQYRTHRRGGEVARVLPGGGNCMSGCQ